MHSSPIRRRLPPIGKLLDTVLADRTNTIPEFGEPGEPSASIRSNPKRAAARDHAVWAGTDYSRADALNLDSRVHDRRTNESPQSPIARRRLREHAFGRIPWPLPKPNRKYGSPRRWRPGLDCRLDCGNSTRLPVRPATARESRGLGALP